MLNRPVLDAIGKAKITWRTETTPRHSQDASLQQRLDEGHIVRNRAARKEVKPALRLDELIAHSGQIRAQEIAFTLILTHVNGHSLELGDDMLHQSRGIDEPYGAVGKTETVLQFLGLRTAWMRGNVAN